MGVFRIQFAMEDESYAALKPKLNIVKERRVGKMAELTIKGSEDEILDLIKQFNPLFCEMLPLTLEELFISEMEEAGYDINNLLHKKSLPENRAGQKLGNQALVSAVCRFISGFFVFHIFE